jgi:lipid-A-disaccharide synthase
MMPIAFAAAKQLQLKLLGNGEEEQERQGGQGGQEGQGGVSTQHSSPSPRHRVTASSDSPLFWIPLSLETYRPAIEAAIQRYGLRATIVADQTQEVLAAADLAITKSGTVNLELALLNVPQVVFYRVSPFTAAIARLLKFSIPFMSPPNLVLMRSIVPELLQEQATVDNIVRESLELLFNSERRSATLRDYQEMRQLLGEVGVCDRAAREILQLATPEKR